MNRRHAVLGAMSACSAWPQAGFAQANPVASLTSDAQLVAHLLRELHPGVLRYLSADALDAHLAEFERSFVAAPDLREIYLALSRMLTRLRCGHSYANFYNQAPAVKAALFNQTSRLPFSFTWLPSGDSGPTGVPQMVITADHSGQNLFRAGTVVQRVNGLEPHRMLAQLLPYTRVDGHNLPKQMSLLSVRGNIQMEYFDVFHGLLFGQPSGGAHRLDLTLPNGQTSSVDAPALTPQQRSAFLPQRNARGSAANDAPVWQWRLQDRVAILTMPGWALYNSKWDWKAWLHERLDGLAADKTARGLVVDIRDNEGGLDCGNEILARYTQQPLEFNEFRRLLRFQTVAPELNPVLDTWDSNFRKLGENATPVLGDVHGTRQTGFFELPSAAQRIEPRGPRLDVPLRVLCSAQNSSATFGFLSRMANAGIGKTVGQTTGGNQRGINGGAFFFVRLPASGLSFDLPLIGSFAHQAKPDAGISPHLAVAQTVQGIANGQDEVLQAALNSL